MKVDNWYQVTNLSDRDYEYMHVINISGKNIICNCYFKNTGSQKIYHVHAESHSEWLLRDYTEKI